MDIFVLSGQSNMAGRGGVYNSHWDHFLPEECQPHPSILRLNPHLQWEQARDPLHADIDEQKVCGIGPGMIFANTILKHSKDPEKVGIGLVPCAIGGTAIKEWEKGSLLYENMITRTKAALNLGGVLRAILWYQGESDTLSDQDANSYKHSLERFIQDIRTDLQHPDLLFIQVAITVGDPPNSELVQKVREAQLSISISYVHYADAKGLPLKDDKLHLTTEAQVQLGKMLADVYENHGISNKICPVAVHTVWDEKDKVCGVGPGMIFANTTLKHYEDPEKARIGLVPCAIGGTAIKEWEKGSTLYKSMITRTKAALNHGGVLRAILWYQGESDTGSEKNANSYKHNIERLIHDIRSDLQHADLLFIQVAITVGDPPYSELVQKVREAQLGVSIPNVYCVDAKGLPLKEDKLHLTTESQVQLGKMLADVYEKHKDSDRSFLVAVHTICDEKEKSGFVQDDPIDCTECSQGLELSAQYEWKQREFMPLL